MFLLVPLYQVFRCMYTQCTDEASNLGYQRVELDSCQKTGAYLVPLYHSLTSVYTSAMESLRIEHL